MASRSHTRHRWIVLAALACLWLGGAPARAAEVKVIDPLTIMYDAERVLPVITEGNQMLNRLGRLDEFDHLYKTLEGLEDRGVLRMVGPINGRCSAQCVVWGEGAGAVHAKIGPLQSGQATIPPDAVMVRYLTNSNINTLKDVTGQTHPDNQFFNRWYNLSYYDVLNEAPPEEADLVPIWVTVRIPRGAPSGLYRGALEVAGRDIPVELTVAPWTFPDPEDFTVHNGHILQSPETLALHYDVPLWSKEHLRLVGKSMRYLGLLGNRSVIVTAKHRTHLGNQSAMIPFREEEGQWVPDFTVMNRYLDIYSRHVRTPDFVTLYVWEPDARLTGRRKPRQESVILTKIVDGEPQEWAAPLFDPEPGSALEVLLNQFREEIRERGWSDTQLLIGMCTDQVPSERIALRFKELAPWAKWVRFSHYRDGVPKPAPDATSCTMFGYMDLGFMEEVTPPCRPTGGWDLGFPRLTILRRVITEYNPLTQFRYAMGVAVGGTPYERYNESASMGICRWALDYWNVSESGSLLLRYERNRWGLMYRPVSVKKLLGPGRDGPVATTRLEMLLEGLQETEARIVLEKALKRDRLPDSLRQECEALLEHRTAVRTRSGDVILGRYRGGGNTEHEIYTRLWAVAPNWQNDTLALFELAVRVTPFLSTKESN